MSNKQTTAVSQLIETFKENIKYLESCLEEQTTELGKIQHKARLAQARYFLNYATESLPIERKQIETTAIKCHFEGVRQSAKTSDEYIKYGSDYFTSTFITE